MAIKEKPNYPQSVVDAVDKNSRPPVTDNRITGFDVTVERVIGHVSYTGSRGKPAMVTVMEMIGGVLDKNPVVDMPVTFRFEYLSEKFRVTVDVEDTA